MTILGRGDLSPPHRRHRRRWPFVLFVLVVVAAGGWFGWHVLRSDDTGKVRAGQLPCRTASPPPVPAPARDVRVRVLNGTKRNGLAHDIRLQLRHRGLRVVAVGNAKATAHTTIVAPRADAASVLALQAQLRGWQWNYSTKPTRTVTFIIGRDFHGLAPPAEAKKRRAADLRAARATPTPCATPSAAS